MNENVRQKLIELARKERTIGYQELSDACRLNLDMRESEFDRAEIGRILGEISRFEHKHKRPLISSLVIGKGDHYQGDGFFKLAEELGFGNWKKLQSDVTFEMGQINSSFAFWKEDSNFNRFK